MVRGEIYWANLNPRSGSEQTGRRPIIIISHDGFNEIQQWCSVIVVPISTSARQANRGPTVVLFPKGTAGLEKGCSALCHQVTTIDRSKLEKRIGTLSPRILSEVEEGLKVALGMEAMQPVE